MIKQLLVRIPVVAMLCAACSNPQSAPVVPNNGNLAYDRTLSYLVGGSPSADDDRTVDACLGEVLTYDVTPLTVVNTKDTTLQLSTEASFDNGAFIATADCSFNSVRLSKDMMRPGYSYGVRNSATTSSRIPPPTPHWEVSNYLGTSFSTDQTIVAPIKLLDTPPADTISKAIGYTFHYSGATGDVLYIRCSYGNVNDIRNDEPTFVLTLPDTGSFTIPAELLDPVPVGRALQTALFHRSYYTLNQAGHKIGYYCGAISNYTFYIAK